MAALSVAALALAGCSHEEAARERSAVAVVAGDVDAPYVIGNRVYGLPGGRVTLEAPVDTTLIATLAPAVVPDSGGRLLAYNAWRGRRPLLRVYDVETGGDSVVAQGAYSPAWRRDGFLAHFQALEPDLSGLAEISRYAGHVVVRRSPRSRAVRWTSEVARYVVAAWAGKRLLAYRVGRRWPDLLALDGPRRSRLLARDAALVAVSPDGRRALVSTYGASPPLVRLLDVGSGRELAHLRLRPPLQWLTEAGSWEGDRVVAKTSAGLAVFRLEDGIELERVIRIPRAAFPFGLFEPREVDGGRVVAWGELPQRPRQAFAGVAVVECDLERLRCVRGQRLSGGVGVRLVYDPSRPSS